MRERNKKRKGSERIGVETREKERKRQEVRYSKRYRGRGRRKSMKEKGELVMVVGTGERLGNIRKKSNRKGVVVVTDGWVSGRLTNHKEYVKYAKKHKIGVEVSVKSLRWYETKRGGIEWWLRGQNGMPGLVVFRNGEKHKVGMKEAMICGIPTVGMVSGSESEVEHMITYGITHGDRLDIVGMEKNAEKTTIEEDSELRRGHIVRKVREKGNKE